MTVNAVRPDTTESALPDAPWPRVKLGEMCEVATDGDWIESKDQSPDGIRLVQTGNIGNGRFENKAGRARYVSKETFERLNCTEVFPGDVLVSRLPDPVGRSCKVPDIKQRMITAVDCTILRFKKALDSDFFVRFSQSQAYQDEIASFITGSTRARISRKNLEQIQIPLPPLPVQRGIVARLDAELARADRMRERFLALAESATARFRAILSETFEQGENGDSWPRVKLGEVCELKSGFTPKPEEIAESGDTPYFRIASMNEAENDVEMVKPIGYYIGKNNRRFPKGALVFPKNGGAALTHKIRYLVTDSIVDLNTGVFLPAESLDTDYLYYWFFALPIDRVLVTGTLPFVDFPRLSQQTLPLPPLPVQQSIVARLDAAQADCGRIEELARKGAEGCVALRAALLKEAFE